MARNDTNCTWQQENANWPQSSINKTVIKWGERLTKKLNISYGCRVAETELIRNHYKWIAHGTYMFQVSFAALVNCLPQIFLRDRSNQSPLWQHLQCPKFIYYVHTRSCVVDVYICGGYNGDTIFGDLWALDLLSLQWRRLPTDLPQPIYFHSSAITTVSKVTAA